MMCVPLHAECMALNHYHVPAHFQVHAKSAHSPFVCKKHHDTCEADDANQTILIGTELNWSHQQSTIKKSESKW
eukprot:1161810-Pelagomonas_calceolata.AAC.15